MQYSMFNHKCVDANIKIEIVAGGSIRSGHASKLNKFDTFQ